MNDTEGARPMSIEHHLALMQSAAAVHARRIVRDLNLPACERADICHDLLMEMIPRLDRYDPDAGAASTYVNVLAHHGAYAVRRRYRRRMANESGGVPLDVDSDSGVTSTSGEVAARETSLQVQRAVSTLPCSLRGLVILLRDGCLGEARRGSGLTHATFYRRLREIRLHFLAEGLDPAG